MKKRGLFLFLLFLAGGVMSAANQIVQERADNPFFQPYNTPYGIPPFDLIKIEHYLPAFEEGIARTRAKIKALANSKSAPTFNNTLLVIDQGDEVLNRVSYVFFNLLETDSSAEMQQIAQKVTQELASLQDEIFLNEKIFRRVRQIYENRQKSGLSAEQKRLTELYYRQFVNRGANLSSEKKKRLMEVNKELALLGLRFSDNVLQETNDFLLVVEKEEDLAGMPEEEIARAADLAEKLNYSKKWVFTLKKPSLIPFLQYNRNRDLREKIYRAYFMRGNNDNASDNKEIIKKIVALRLERANLLGFSNHARWALQETMARTPENVLALLNQLWEKTVPLMKADLAKLQAIADEERAGIKIAPWDWWYYAEKLRKREYDLDENQLKPYFRLENVIAGLFKTVEKLYGLKISQLKEAPLPHPSARCYEIRDEDGALVGILIADFFIRDSKRGGAWMNVYRDQYRENGQDIRPIVTLVTNFAPDSDSSPTLLSFDEVKTLFHEFGHCLHGLLSKCSYRGLSGTNVPRDFVELPSQIMENWALAPEVLNFYARNYKTGEIIPAELVERIRKSSFFNQGFELGEYLAAALLDMRWHLLEKIPADLDVNKFEAMILKEIGLIPEILPRYRSTYFTHIFYTGYDAGYYSYIWSEVLDADAFEVFEEKGIFDSETARAFRQNILEKGNSDDVSELYRQFRKRDPKVNALLKRKGLQ